jgi:hypothetical protein
MSRRDAQRALEGYGMCMSLRGTETIRRLGEQLPPSLVALKLADFGDILQLLCSIIVCRTLGSGR